jgi:hypothetical protein
MIVPAIVLLLIAMAVAFVSLFVADAAARLAALHVARRVVLGGTFEKELYSRAPVRETIPIEPIPPIATTRDILLPPPLRLLKGFRLWLRRHSRFRFPRHEYSRAEVLQLVLVEHAAIDPDIRRVIAKIMDKAPPQRSEPPPMPHSSDRPLEPPPIIASA